MRSLSASKLEQAMSCVASTVLPGVSSTNDRAERGNWLHLYITKAIKIGDAAALELIAEEYRDECAAIDMEPIRELLLERTYCELGMIYDTTTEAVTVIGEFQDRGYGELSSNKIGVTSDIATIGNGKLRIIEIKTGQPVTAAKNNWQLKLQTLAASVSIDEIEAPFQASIAYLGENGSWWFDDATFDEMDMDIAAGQLKQLTDRRAVAEIQFKMTGSVDVAEGEWCRYCPAMKSCQAKTGLVRHMGDAIGALTAESAAKAWPRVQQYKLMLAEIEREIESMARETPIKLASGKVLKEVESSREYINGAKAYSVVEKHLGKEGVDKAFTLGTSKAAIDRAAPKELRKRILSELRESGAIQAKTYRSVKEVDQ